MIDLYYCRSTKIEGLICKRIFYNRRCLWSITENKQSVINWSTNWNLNNWKKGTEIQFQLHVVIALHFNQTDFNQYYIYTLCFLYTFRDLTLYRFILYLTMYSIFNFTMCKYKV